MKMLMALCLTVLSIPVIADVSTEAGLSMIRTGGNTELETYNLSSKSTKAWEKRSLTFGGHYTLGTSVERDETTQREEKLENARNWDVYTKVEEVLSNKVNGFFQIQYEGNTFAGYKQRENFDLGGKYKFIDSEKTKFFSELGLRYTIEKATQRNDDNEDVFEDTKGVFYTEYSHVYSKTVNYKFWIQYLPNFTREEDYQINFEPSVNVTLSDMFSLKVAYTGRYDNELNQGVEERLDWTHTTTLIAKF